MRRSMVVMSIVGLLGMASVVHAEGGAWEFNVTPYAWGMGIKGDVEVGRFSAPMDVKFADAVKDLDLAGMIALEAHNGNWGVLCDLAYMKLSDDTETLTGSLSAEVEESILQGAAVYRVVNSKATRIDLGVGGRYMSLDAEVDTANGGDSRTVDIGDPLIVVRVQEQISDNVFGLLAGDIGGFGASSELTWQLTAAVGYGLTEKVSLMLGYRYLHYDYDNDRVVYDVAMHGIATGVQIGF